MNIQQQLSHFAHFIRSLLFPNKNPQIRKRELTRLNTLLVATARPEMEMAAPIRMTVAAFDSDEFHCKCQQLLPEGTRLKLSVQFFAQEPRDFRVVVDWVNLSSFGHSLGLRVLHQEDSRDFLHQQSESLLRSCAPHVQAS